MLDARSPKYPALYDPHSGVRFRSGRAEVTEEQALALAERRYVDGILIDGTPAKDWAKGRRRDGDEPLTDPAVVPPQNEPVDEGRRRAPRSR